MSDAEEIIEALTKVIEYLTDLLKQHGIDIGEHKWI